MRELGGSKGRVLGALSSAKRRVQIWSKLMEENPKNSEDLGGGLPGVVDEEILGHMVGRDGGGLGRRSWGVLTVEETKKRGG